MQLKSSSLGGRLLPLVVIVLVGGFLCYVGIALSHAQHEDQFSKASLKELTAAQAKDPNDTNLLYELAHRLERDGHNEEAFETAQKLVQKEPGNLVYWQALARCASEAGHAVEALSAYRKGCELSPSWGMGYLKQAEILAEAGMTTEALAEYDRGIKLDPKAETNAETWARCLMVKGRYQEAWDCIRAAMAHTMVSDGCYHLLTDLAIRLGRSSEMVTFLDQRISYTPLYPVGKYRDMQILASLPDKPNAETLSSMETIAQGSVEEKWPLAECYFVLGKVRMLRGNLAGAASALETGSKLSDQDTSDCLKLLIEIYGKMGRADQVQQTWSRFKKQYGETPELAQLRQAAEKTPRDVAALTALAKGLEAAGKYGEAVDAYDLALEVDPKEPTALAAREPLREKALERLAHISKQAVKPKQM